MIAIPGALTKAGMSSRAGAAPPAAPDVSFLPSARRTVVATLVLLAVASGFWLLYRLAGVLFDVFFALVLGTAFRPWVDALARRGLSRRSSGLLVSGGIFAVLATAVVLLTPTLARQISEVTAELPRHLQAVSRWLGSSSSTTVQQIARDLPGVQGRASPLSGGQAVNYLGSGAQGALNLICVWLLSFYWLVDGERMTRTILVSVSEPRRELVRELVEEAESKVGGYVRGQLLVCLSSAVMSVVAYLIIGLPNALLLGIFFGALAVLPVLGAPIGALPAVLIALSTNPRLVFWVVLAAVVVHLIQDYALAPRLVGRRVGVNAFTVLLAVTAFGSLVGLAGAVLAIPMAAIVQMFVDRFVFVESDAPPAAPPARDRLSVLRLEAAQLANDVRKQSRELEPKPDASFDRAFDLVESLAKDVEKRLAGDDGSAGAS